MKLEIIQCSYCLKETEKPILKAYQPTNFVGMKDNKPNIFEYCSKECIKKQNEEQVRAIVPLAYLDKAMNYSAYFVRNKGDEGWYINGEDKIEVKGTDDYKTQDLPFILHPRYKEQAPDWMFTNIH